MAENPVERNPITRFLLGLAVIAGMFLGGGAVGWLFREAGVPYGDWIGVAVGAIAAFLLFTIVYSRYADPFDGE